MTMESPIYGSLSPEKSTNSFDDPPDRSAWQLGGDPGRLCCRTCSPSGAIFQKWPQPA